MKKGASMKKTLRSILERERSKPVAPGFFLMLNQEQYELGKDRGWDHPVFNLATEKWDYSCYGSHAKTMKARWDHYWDEVERWNVKNTLFVLPPIVAE